jgi:RNA polymerase sigma-70 factor (ECF subfamily)
MNASLDILRRKSGRPDASNSDEREEDRQPRLEPVHELTPEHEVGLAELQLLVQTAVARLAPVHRQAITLREFEDCSYEEIAEAVACPIGTVMSRLHHARNRLAEDLSEVAGFRAELWAA